MGEEKARAKKQKESEEEEMIEAIFAWLCLFIGIVTQNANYFIASGVFAVAAQIELYRKKGGE